MKAAPTSVTVGELGTTANEILKDDNCSCSNRKSSLESNFQVCYSVSPCDNSLTVTRKYHLRKHSRRKRPLLQSWMLLLFMSVTALFNVVAAQQLENSNSSQVFLLEELQDCPMTSNELSAWAFMTDEEKEETGITELNPCLLYHIRPNSSIVEDPNTVVVPVVQVTPAECADHRDGAFISLEVHGNGYDRPRTDPTSPRDFQQSLCLCILSRGNSHSKSDYKP